VIMLFWVNLHPGFIAGLAAIGAYLLIELSDLLFAERRQAALLRLRRVWPWLAACGAATLVNPWGAKIYAASLNMVGPPVQSREGSMATSLSLSSWVSPSQPICCISSLMCDIRSVRIYLVASAGGDSRRTLFSGSGNSVPDCCACRTLCRFESCALLGAVRNLRRDFGCRAYWSDAFGATKPRRAALGKNTLRHCFEFLPRLPSC
jgi:hypothetical protein